jgi:predicted HTH domain antitoxin
MTLELGIDYPETLLDALNYTWEQFEPEAKWAIAVKLFEMKRISSGVAAQLDIYTLADGKLFND